MGNRNPDEFSPSGFPKSHVNMVRILGQLELASPIKAGKATPETEAVTVGETQTAGGNEPPTPTGTTTVAATPEEPNT